MDDDEIDTDQLLSEISLEDNVHEEKDDHHNVDGPQVTLPQNREMVSIVRDELSSDEDEEENEIGTVYQTRSKWWFMDPVIRKNRKIVLLILMFFLVGISFFIVGIVLEVIYHNGVEDVIRGIVFMLVSFIILLPSVYAIIHVYLAAKRIGKVTFSTVWFFTNH